MKEPYSANINSDDIRKGLASLRNSQAQLLSELKNQTQAKRKGITQLQQSLTDSTERARWELIYPPLKNNTGDSYLQQSSKSFTNRMNTSTKSSVQEDLIQQNNYLKNQTKLTNSHLQKWKNSYQSQKEKTKDLENYIEFTSKLYYQLLDKLFQDDHSIITMKQFLIQNMKTNESTYAKININQLQKLLELLQTKQHLQVSLLERKQNENTMNSQLLDLRNQLDKMLKANIIHTQKLFNSDRLINNLKEQLALKNKQNQANIKKIAKMQFDYKEVKLLLEKQLNDKKNNVTDLQKLKKLSVTWQQKQKKIIFYAKEMQNKKTKVEQELNQKKNQQQQYKQNYERLQMTINKLKEDNQHLKKQIERVETTKQKLINEQTTFAKQRQNELRTIIEQQTVIAKKYQIELTSLRNMLNDAKKNIEELKKSQKTSDVVEKDVPQKIVNQQRIQILRTNTLIDHLWQVKEVQYQNINDLISSFQK